MRSLVITTKPTDSQPLWYGDGASATDRSTVRRARIRGQHSARASPRPPRHATNATDRSTRTCRRRSMAAARFSRRPKRYPLSPRSTPADSDVDTFVDLRQLVIQQAAHATPFAGIGPIAERQEPQNPACRCGPARQVRIDTTPQGSRTWRDRSLKMTPRPRQTIRYDCDWQHLCTLPATPTKECHISDWPVNQ
jgi:hypothetical protein